MNLEQYIIHSILEYPTLYKDINYQYSKEKVLNHLFFTNGNGMEWHNGELIDQISGDSEEIIKFPEGFFTTPIWTTEEDEDEVMKGWRLEDDKEYKPFEKCSKYALNIYPICEYANITSLPKEIKDDWLLGAEEAIELALAYYADPYKHARNTYINEWILTRNFESIQNFLTKQNNYLVKAGGRVKVLKTLRRLKSG
ncbi:MAG: hypothetical protein DRI65_04385 [Chloroflexota bacterium]|nr:MAG: hypothetical protein DRI65_04385 [Chloroflexota bacterium]